MVTIRNDIIIWKTVSVDTEIFHPTFTLRPNILSVLCGQTTCIALHVVHAHMHDWTGSRDYKMLMIRMFGAPGAKHCMITPLGFAPRCKSRGWMWCTSTTVAATSLIILCSPNGIAASPGAVACSMQLLTCPTGRRYVYMWKNLFQGSLALVWD